MHVQVYSVLGTFKGFFVNLATLKVTKLIRKGWSNWPKPLLGSALFDQKSPNLAILANLVLQVRGKAGPGPIWSKSPKRRFWPILVPRIREQAGSGPFGHI